MATLESMAIRANEALDEIEMLLDMPKESIMRLYRDPMMLKVIQLEAIASALRERKQSNEKDIETMFELSMSKLAPSPLNPKPATVRKQATTGRKRR